MQLKIDSVSKEYLGRKVLDNLSFSLGKKEIVGLVGENGSGKTTLLKIMAGLEQPDSGLVEIGPGVDSGYLPQEHGKIDADLNLLDYLISKTLDRTSVYRLAKRFLFNEVDFPTKVADLSSGQATKLLLAKLMAAGTNFLILDEPTNHLDIPGREALEKALASYEGTLLVTSHDRYFLEKIALTKIVRLH